MKATSPLPKNVGRYRVIAKLGQGGMATALLALSEGPGGFRKLSVIKQLRVDLCDDPNFISMFLDEARIAALLNHPNVVQTNEVGESGDTRFISMEYLQGQSLARVLYRIQGGLPLGMHLRVITEALTGLHYVHQLSDLSGKALGVVHRDISPGNLFMTYDGCVKVLDFGIAKAEGGQAITEVGSFKGKLAYVAPEQAKAHDIDGRADVFSVGVLLWEALAHRPLVRRDEAAALTLQNRVKGLEPSIDEVAPDAPAVLREICKRAMALEPEDRYGSAKEFCDALSAAARETGNLSSREEQTEVMAGLFDKERQAIADTIAKTISVEDPFESDEAMRLSWESSTAISISMAPVEFDESADEAVTSEIFKMGMSQADHSQPDNLPHSQPDHSAYTTSKPASSGYHGTAVAVVLGLALVIGAIVYLVSSEETSPASESKAVAPISDEAAEAAATAEPDAATVVSLRISVTPADTVLRIDGKKLSGNPVTASYDYGLKEHELVASAEGYETVTRTIRFDRNLELKFALHKEVDADQENVDIQNDSDRKIRKDRDRKDRTNRKAKETSSDPVQATAPNPTKTKVGSKPGDALDKRNDKASRPIDKDNPYQ